MGRCDWGQAQISPKGVIWDRFKLIKGKKCKKSIAKQEKMCYTLFMLYISEFSKEVIYYCQDSQEGKARVRYTIVCYEELTNKIFFSMSKII